MNHDFSQNKRVYAVDLARGLAVLFMIGVHVLDTYSSHELQHTVLGLIIAWLGGPPSAPVFMALMGVSFYYSRNTDLKFGIKRGLEIILLGYILNILRGILPIFVVSLLAPSVAESIPQAVANYHDAFVELDILQFAGLSLIVMAIIRELKFNKYILLCLSVIIGFISPMLWNITPNIPVAGYFLDYLWGDKPSSMMCIGNLVSFPFFPWFTFVLIGMFLGDSLTKSTNLHETFKKAGIIGCSIMIVSLIIIVPNMSYHMHDYYHSRPGFVAFMAGFILVWIYICDVITKYIKMNGVFSIIFYWSRNVTSLYVIQWVIIMAGADAVFGFNHCSYFATSSIIISVTIGSYLINDVYLRFRSKEYTGHVKALLQKRT
jgi:uncharacterized membrane protein